MSALLTVSGLCVALRAGRRWLPVVEHLDFAIAAGETLALVGESGSGKSMTAQALIRLLPDAASITQGSIHLDGADLATLSEEAMCRLRGEQVAMIFQEPMTALNPVYPVGSQIAETLLLHRDISRKAARERAVELLELVRIPRPREVATAYPHQLSGGMRQRVAIAIALACEPALLIADEPTTALDVTSQARILDLLADLQERFHMGLLLITHDLAVVAQTADRVAVMYAGRIVEQGMTGDVFAAPVHPYTAGLLTVSRLADHAPGARLPEIPGVAPVPGARPAGCAFADRCSASLPLCHGRVPESSLLSGPGRRSFACHAPNQVPEQRSRTV